jgi:signal transduction histidine kinase
MSSLYQQITQLLSNPYGSMAYHLLISFILISVLHPALGFSLIDKSSKSKRILVGLGLLLGSRLLLFTASGLSAIGFAQTNLLLPIIDRTVNAFTLVIIIWLLVFQEPNRSGDIGTIIASAITFIGGIASMVIWSSQGTLNTFNDQQSSLALGWSIFTILLLLGGELLLITQDPEDQNLGLTMLGIIFLGEVIQLLSPDRNSDFPSMVRLAFIAAFPLMLGVAKRFKIPKDTETLHVQPPIGIYEKEGEKSGRDKLLYLASQKGIDLKLFQTTMALASVNDPQEICQLLSLYISHALVADICILLTPPDANEQVHLICGYDLIVEESLASTSFDHTIIPGYLEALEKGHPLQVPTEKSNSLVSFADLLDLDELGNFLAYPVTDTKGKTLAAIVLISPYSKYIWTVEDQTYLKESVSIIADVIQRTQSGDQNIVSHLTEQLKGIEAEKEKLVQENENLAAELAILATQIEYQGSDSQDITSELNRSIEQINTLETELNRANQKATAFEDRTLSNGGVLSIEQAEVISSIAQELRQPMSSIGGYTDLMISESVGVLGALQRKFLERVKASTDRMNHLIGDLIQITTLESGNLALTPQAIELMDVIDEAIEVTSTQFREKKITLRVDLPHKLPKMNTDKDALHQIMLHLLLNAGAAVPVEGEIFIKAEASEKNDEEIIRIEVTDTGGGIPKEDLPRVFSRLYRADNPLIQGVGDTGVGLSIAKTLTEALGGRIWVESELGVGSTFSVMMPITPQISDTYGG